MARNQLSFFAAKADLESLLRSVECERRLQYVVAGLFDSPNVQPMQSLLDAPDLGHVAVGDANHATAYLAASREVSIQVRSVPQRQGSVMYAVDQLVNPKTIALRPGGAFGEACLIAGQLGTASVAPSSLDLFQLFSKDQTAHLRGLSVTSSQAGSCCMGRQDTAAGRCPAAELWPGVSGPPEGGSGNAG